MITIEHSPNPDLAHCNISKVFCTWDLQSLMARKGFDVAIQHLCEGLSEALNLQLDKGKLVVKWSNQTDPETNPDGAYGHFQIFSYDDAALDPEGNPIHA